MASPRCREPTERGVSIGRLSVMGTKHWSPADVFTVIFLAGTSRFAGASVSDPDQDACHVRVDRAPEGVLLAGFYVLKAHDLRALSGSDRLAPEQRATLCGEALHHGAFLALFFARNDPSATSW